MKVRTISHSLSTILLIIGSNFNFFPCTLAGLPPLDGQWYPMPNDEEYVNLIRKSRGFNYGLDMTKSIGYEIENVHDIVGHNGGDLPTRIVVHHHYHPPIHVADTVHPTDPADGQKLEEFETAGLGVGVGARHNYPGSHPAIQADVVQSVEIDPKFLQADAASEIENIQKSNVYRVEAEPEVVAVRRPEVQSAYPVVQQNALMKVHGFGFGQVLHGHAVHYTTSNNHNNNLVLGNPHGHAQAQAHGAQLFNNQVPSQSQLFRYY